MATACAALLLAASVAVTGCSVQVAGRASPNPAAVAVPVPRSSTVPDDLFRDAQGRFGLVPPPGWTVDTSGAQGTAVVFLDPRPTETPAGRFSANINVLVVPSPADLDATVNGAMLELQGLTDYRSTEDEPVTLPDGTPAHIIGGAFRVPASGFALRNVQLVAVHDGTAIVATGTSFEESWDVYEGAFQASLRSLTVAT